MNMAHQNINRETQFCLSRVFLYFLIQLNDSEFHQVSIMAEYAIIGLTRRFSHFGSQDFPREQS